MLIYFYKIYLRKDSIFLIARNSKEYQYQYQEYQYQFKIFGISERNTALKLKFYGDFGSPTLFEIVSFPDVITSMKNGKFLFYQQSSHRQDFPEEVLRIDVEKWQQNEDWNRSVINFSFNFTDETEVFWIFKV